MKNKILLGLSLAIVFQFLVLSGMYASASLPLWTGTEIKIKTTPVDPRSIFRGNYARLNYEITQIERSHFSEADDLRNGDVVYITLKLNINESYDFSSASLVKPDSGIFLRGRIDNRRYEDEAEYFRIKYGIEAFFAPKERALALEKDLRDGGIAVLMVSNAGKARIKDVIANNI